MGAFMAWWSARIGDGVPVIFAQVDSTAITVSMLIDWAMRGSVIGLFIYFFFTLKKGELVWGYQLREEKERADKWEKLALEYMTLARGAVTVAAKTSGVTP